MTKAEKLIKDLGLSPHPEGGFYKETYRSEHSTAIYYLLSRGQKSRLHRIKSDELWHFYAGDSLVVVEILESGEVKETKLSQEKFQHMVPGGTWFGAYLPEGAEFALVGCTVAPAFRYEDFEFADKEQMMASYPKAKGVIERLIS